MDNKEIRAQIELRVKDFKETLEPWMVAEHLNEIEIYIHLNSANEDGTPNKANVFSVDIGI